MEKFIENGEWQVESAILSNQLKFYGSEKVPYPDVTLTLDLQRRSLYYGLNIVIPCALITLLGLLSFMLPSNHGERMSLVITVLLAQSVYMLIVSSSLPETSDAVPALGIYCLGIIITIALCLFATSLTLKFRDMACPMPEWLEVLVIRNMGRFLFVNFGEEDLSHNEISHSIDSDITLEKFTSISDNVVQNCQPVNIEHTPAVAIEEKLLKPVEESLLAEMQFIADTIRAKQDKEALEKKWKRVAKILDRFFLMSFFIVYVSLVAYLLSSM